MSKLDDALNRLIGNVPECVAGGYVDLTSGLLLAIKTVDSHPSTVIDLVAAATSDLFQGHNVSTIETLFKRARGVEDDSHHYFQEILVNSDNLIHVFLRGKQYPDYVVVLVCRRSANLGMVLSKTRMGIAEIEAAV